jgi:hypothetical protein
LASIFGTAQFASLYHHAYIQNCWQWQEYMIQNDFAKNITIDPVYWELPGIHVPGGDPFGHAAVRVQAPGQTALYLDDGAWGRGKGGVYIFHDKDIPWYMAQYEAKRGG